MLAEISADEPNGGDAKRIRELERQLAQVKSNYSSLKERYTHTENDLAAANKTIELFTATQDVFTTAKPKRAAHSRDGEATAVVVGTDWHCEETVDPKTVNGVNTFNLEIADKRIKQLWEKAVLLTEGERHLSKIKTCLLALLGDLMGGHIHEELLETNSLSPCEAVLWLQDRLEYGIRFLLKHGGFESIEVQCTSGNHGRDTKKQRISTREKHSYEWLVYQNVRRWFRNEPRVRFVIADGILTYADVQGHRLRLTHGDAIKYAGGVGGLGIPASKRVAKWDEAEKAYLTLFGHWHQMVIGGRYIACPTLKGYDPFSVWIGAPPEPPSQLFAVIDKHRGLTCAKRLFVE